jgi:putative transposase
MPNGLKRYQQRNHLHFLNFSCTLRRPLLDDHAKATFEEVLEALRTRHEFCITGYVLMPEHVHLLLSEPAARTLDVTLRVLKTQTAKRRKQKHAPLWAPRYYDFNVFTEAKRIEKLRYIHRNPVTRGLVAHPEDWPWSSFVHYATGTPGRVEIESPWTAQKRALPMCPNKNRAL